MSRGIIASLGLHALALVPLLFMFVPQLDAPAGRAPLQTRFIAQTVNIEALRSPPVPLQPQAPAEIETLTPLTSESEQGSTVAPVQPEQVAQMESEPLKSEAQLAPESVKPRLEPKEPVRAEPLPKLSPEQALARDEAQVAKSRPPAPQKTVAAVHDAPAAGTSVPSATSHTSAEGGGGGAPDSSYLMEIRALLEAHKTYPVMAQRRGMEGDVHLWFVINRQGRVLDYRISKGSGYEMLDEEVERLIQAISQFPPVPSEVGSDLLEFIVPVSFRLAG